MITALNSASGITETRRKRKKKPRGPNPLSVKKSRKVRGGGVSITTGGVASQTKVCVHVCAHGSMQFACVYSGVALLA